MIVRRLPASAASDPAGPLLPDGPVPATDVLNPKLPVIVVPSVTATSFEPASSGRAFRWVAATFSRCGWANGDQVVHSCSASQLGTDTTAADLVTRRRLRTLSASLELGSARMGGDVIDDQVDEAVPQLWWEVVSHSFDELEPCAGDQLRGTTTTGRVDDGVLVAVDHQGSARCATRRLANPTPRSRTTGALRRRGRSNARSAGAVRLRSLRRRRMPGSHRRAYQPRTRRPWSRVCRAGR
jgi:hypothetical protein